MSSLYVHVPFCERKCLYCDFYSVTDTERVEDFLAALEKEITRLKDHGKGATFETIFFGGGTPSLLTPGQVERILLHLHAAYRIAPEAEVTLEANPGTVTGEKMRAFRSLGINRLSIGIQSFHDHELKILGRIHDRAEAFQCIQLARAAGFANISLDLIYAIPGQTLAEWEDNLRTAVDLMPQHIAAYSLVVEDGTPLDHMIRAGQVHTNPPDLEAEMYERTMQVFGAHGYDHYEVSNYALSGFRCRHNGNYWSHENYLGFGPSAHSFWKDDDAISGRRWWNVAELSMYLERLNAGILPVEAEEQVGPREMLNERIFLGLRTSGLDPAGLKRDYDFEFADLHGDTMQWLLDQQMAILEGGILHLPSKGFLLCDEICRKLFQ
ncbi:MAG TPA: radical SAM family heme chaperone HemW [Candidatus Methylomirabilis sp.]|nr:radical SAM family heme chaperone HemW [Candidatus Methylomirabilis sp.]